MSSPLITASDGGCDNGVGSFGLVFHCSSQVILQNFGPVSGANPSSFRSEALGVLAVVRILFHLFKFFGVLPQFIFDHYMDNKGVISRLQKLLLLPKVDPNAVFLPEWDVLYEIKMSLSQINARISLHHVKSHQDTTVESNNLSLHAKLNVQCDALATCELQSASPPSPIVPLFPSTRCHLVTKGKTITSRLKSTVRTAFSLNSLKEYMCNRKGWNAEIWNDINWSSHRYALNKKFKNRRRIIQLIHGKLPIARDLSKRLPTHTSLCSACNTAEETNSHLLCCQNPEYKKWRLTFSRGLVTLCHNLQTDPVLVDVLLYGIQQSFEAAEAVSPGLSSKYSPLLLSQGYIGWYGLFTGHFSRRWQSLQQEYLSSSTNTDNFSSAQHWTSKILVYFWDHWLNLWKLRNSFYHGRDKNDQDLSLKSKAKAELEYLYKIKPHVEVQNQDLYMESISVHLNEPVTRQLLWVRMYKQLLVESKNRLKSRTKEDIRKFFSSA